MDSAREVAASEILDSLSNGVLLLDAELQIQYSNRNAGRLLGIFSQQALGRPASEFLSEELTGTAGSVRELGHSRLGVPGQVRSADGEWIPVRGNISRLASASRSQGSVVLSLARLTALDHRERRLQLAERLGALGRLTEGVAHVLRNPLAGIAAGVEFVGRKLESDEAQRGNVVAILREVDRLNGLLEDMVQITHPAPVVAAPARVETVLEEVAAEVRGRLPAVEVRTSCASDVGSPRLDREQIRRAVLELTLNAAEATPPGGSVRVSASLEPPDADTLEREGLALRIDIQDSGKGFSETMRRFAFEPFRSTKSGSKGLGLYISRDIAERHGGEIQIRDVEGGGSRVSLLLPWETESA